MAPNPVAGMHNLLSLQVRASLVQTRTELQVAAAVQAMQLDNQLLGANNPVVLSPADTTNYSDTRCGAVCGGSHAGGGGS